MAIKEILLLGNSKLYEVSSLIGKEELKSLTHTIEDLHDTLIDFRNRYGAGRAIASPQIGTFKRLLYMNIDKPIVFINPVLEFKDDEKIEIWDDCMCFPDLLVKVSRYRRCVIKFMDINWEQNEMKLEGDLAELLQHEYDHLNGILATSRAINEKSFALRSQKNLLR